MPKNNDLPKGLGFNADNFAERVIANSKPSSIRTPGVRKVGPMINIIGGHGSVPFPGPTYGSGKPNYKIPAFMMKEFRKGLRKFKRDLEKSQQK
jgi:hypothetical protein